MTGHAQPWRITAGTPVDLGAIEPSSTPGAPGDKAATNEATASVGDRLRAVQDRLWAEEARSLLVVLQAMDTGGKDGTIKHVFRAVNPQGVRVAAFKVPTDEELSHDFLWRIHQRAPRRGEIGVFNRSHYEDVVVVRVKKLVPEAVWRDRYQRINEFEANLVAAGTQIVKLFLHISRGEQAARLQARLDDPTKRWKFNPDDLAERARWDDYMAAYAEAIERTSTDAAPWYVIPADKKWYRNWAAATVLVDTLEAMDPRYPEPAEPLDDVVIS